MTKNSQKWLTIREAVKAFKQQGKHMNYHTLQRYCREGEIPPTKYMQDSIGRYLIAADLPYRMRGIDQRGERADKTTPMRCPVCGVTEGTRYTMQQARAAGVPEAAGKLARFYPRRKDTGYAKTTKCKICHYDGREPRHMTTKEERERLNQPPHGYVTAHDARDILGVSRERLRQHVLDCRIKSVQAPGMKRTKFYDLEDILRVKAETEAYHAKVQNS